MSKKVIIVGRHTPDLGAESANYEVVASEAVTFAMSRDEVVAQVHELVRKAQEAGAEAILFQNVPGVLASALVRMFSGETLSYAGMLRFGIIISVPGERQAGVSKTFEFSTDPDSVYARQVKTSSAAIGAEAVKFANGRATTSVEDGVLTVTVDPVTPFVFSHIEWL